MIGAEQIATLTAIAVMAAGAAFGGYHYREVHLVEFQAIKAEYLYDKCMRECITVCEANRVDPKQCDCSHCEKYLEAE